MSDYCIRMIHVIVGDTESLMIVKIFQEVRETAVFHLEFISQFIVVRGNRCTIAPACYFIDVFIFRPM